MDKGRRTIIASLAAGSLSGGAIVYADQFFQQDDAETQAASSTTESPTTETTTEEPTATETTTTETTTATETTTTEPTTEESTATDTTTAETTTETTTEEPTTTETTTTETTTSEPTTTETTTTEPDPASKVEVSFRVVQNTKHPGTIYDYKINNDNDFAVDVTLRGDWEWANGEKPSKTETVTAGAYDIVEGSFGTPSTVDHEELVSHNASVGSIQKA